MLSKAKMAFFYARKPARMYTRLCDLTGFTISSDPEISELAQPIKLANTPMIPVSRNQILSSTATAYDTSQQTADESSYLPKYFQGV